MIMRRKQVTTRSKEQEEDERCKQASGLMKAEEELIQ